MKRLVKAVLVLLVTTAVGALAEMPVYDKMTLEIYAHSSVLMEQAAADIWPFVIDPNSWKQGLKLRHVDGEQNQVGQVFAALASPGDATPQLYVKNVEVIPNQLRTIKLMSPADGDFLNPAVELATEHEGFDPCVGHGQLKTWDRVPPDRIHRVGIGVSVSTSLW